MPKTSSYGSPNPLLCPSCGDYRYLVLQNVIFEAPIDRKIILRIPFFHCKVCNQSDCLWPRAAIKDEANKLLAERVSDHESCGFSSQFEEKRFSAYDSLGFRYDSLDYYCIPGLYRPWDEGDLTPVFFEPDLLVYYNSHPDYRVVLSSFSGVTIYDYSGEELVSHGFGINRNGKLFAWLGDLHMTLSRPENRPHLLRFLASNTESDHDVVSDFYFGEIEAEFTGSDNEGSILGLKKEFEDRVLSEFGFTVSNVKLDGLPMGYKQPIMDEANQVFNAYNQLNKVLVESLQRAELKKALVEYGAWSKEMEGLGGLKLLEFFCQRVLNFSDTRELIGPLFVLYDLRQLADHLSVCSFDEKYNSCKQRLSCDISMNHIEFYRRVVSSLREMYNELNRRLISRRHIHRVAAQQSEH